MIIYNTDGTIRKRVNDDFGRWCGEGDVVVVGPNTTLKDGLLGPIVNWKDHIIIEVIEPRIKLAKIINVQETIPGDNKDGADKNVPRNRIEGPLVPRTDKISNGGFDGTIPSDDNSGHRREEIRCNKPIEPENGTGLQLKLENFYNKTREMHSELDSVRACFEWEESRLQNLLRETEKLRENWGRHRPEREPRYLINSATLS